MFQKPVQDILNDLDSYEKYLLNNYASNETENYKTAETSLTVRNIK